jgi:hypothetical protein
MAADEHLSEQFSGPYPDSWYAPTASEATHRAGALAGAKAFGHEGVTTRGVAGRPNQVWAFEVTGEKHPSGAMKFGRSVRVAVHKSGRVRTSKVYPPG